MYNKFLKVMYPRQPQKSNRLCATYCLWTHSLHLRTLQNMNDPDLVLFGKRVRMLREQKGLSQESLADLSGMHRTYIGSLERGTRNVSLRNILRIARALGVPPAAILPDENGSKEAR